MNRKKRIRDHHLFFDLWLTPWSWMRPGVWRSKGSIYAVCVGFGKLELIID